jgi:hypothetical protein
MPGLLEGQGKNDAKRFRVGKTSWAQMKSFFRILQTYRRQRNNNKRDK